MSKVSTPRFGLMHKGGVLVDNETEQKVITEIVRLRNEEDWSYNRIAGHLNAHEMLNRGRYWSNVTVRSVYRKATPPSEQKHERTG